jgi:hypothetical protein
MPKINKKEERIEKPNKPIYTAKDFFAMEAELEKFAIDKAQMIKGELKMAHYVPVEGIQRWYINNGGLSDHEEWIVLNILKFRELQEKMEQYNNWIRRKEFAVKMKNIEYQQEVEKLEVNMKEF